MVPSYREAVETYKPGRNHLVTSTGEIKRILPPGGGDKDAIPRSNRTGTSSIERGALSFPLPGHGLSVGHATGPHTRKKGNNRYD